MRSVIRNLVVLGTVFSASVALAQPATQPSGRAKPDQRAVDDRMMDGRMLDGRVSDGRVGDGRSGRDNRSMQTPGQANRLPGGFGGRGIPFEISEEQWNEAASFMKSNSPKRFEVFTRFSEENSNRSEAISRMKWRIWNRFNQLEQLSQIDPDRYAAILESERAVDDMWGIALRINNDTALGDVDRAALEADLRKKVTGFVDRLFKQREQSLEERRRKLDAEQAQLKTEMEHRDQAIETRLQQMLSGHADFGGFGGPDIGNRRGNRPGNLPPAPAPSAD